MMRYPKKNQKFVVHVMVLLLCAFLLVGCAGSDDGDGDDNPSTDTENQADTQTDTDSTGNTATETDSDASTDTDTGSQTNTATDTSTATNTVTDTSTATNTVTDTSTATNTATNTATDTSTATNTATETETESETETETEEPWADLVGIYTLVSFNAEIGGTPLNSDDFPSASGRLTIAASGRTTIVTSVLGRQFRVPFQIIDRSGNTITVEGDDCPRSSATFSSSGNNYTLTIRSGFCGEDSSGTFVYRRTSSLAATSDDWQQLDEDDYDRAYDTIYDLIYFLEENVIYNYE